jgi:hypothetical protein
LVDGQIINETNTINFTVSNDIVYRITCISLNSKPQINLNIIDTNTKESLIDESNSAQSGSCNQFNLCERVLQINFRLNENSKFINMSSLTCEANSINEIVDLSVNISRNVEITFNPSIYFK